MTKYKITNNGRLYEYIRKYKDYNPDPVFRNTVRESAKDKLFSNPVTSIAYTHEFPKTLGSDYDMDKKDIIKALDFWINDKVLQNEKMLALNGNLKDFEETELKSLIGLKSIVLSMPNDTIFKRFNRANPDDYYLLISDTVEFYYPMAAAPFLNPRKHIPTISDDNRNIRDGFTFNWRPLDDIARAALFGAHEHRFDFGDTTPVRPPGYFRVGDDDFRDEITGRHITGARHSDVSRTTVGQPPSSTDTTEEHNTTFENMYVNTVTFYNLGRGSTEVEYGGENGVVMNVKINGFCFGMDDGRPHTIYILGDPRTIEIDGTYYTVIEPIRVSYSILGGGIQTTTSGTPTYFDGNDDLYTDYLNMICITYYDQEVGSDHNSYLTTNMTFSGSLVDIDLQIYVTNSAIDTISALLQSHIVRIFTHRKDIIEIDGHRVHVLSMDVTYK